MQRRSGRLGGAVAAAAAFSTLALALAGCTGSGGNGLVDDGEDSGTASSPSAASSGKYRTLPEACASVDSGQLSDLLPGAESADAADDGNASPGADAEGKAPSEALAGKPILTYDSQRRAGCEWQTESAQGQHQLKVRFERVVSYNDNLSDDDRAAEVFLSRAEKHGFDPASSTVPTEEPTAGDDASGSGDPSPSESGSTGSADPSLAAPRALEDLGDEAFLDDDASAADTSARRDVTVVFRTSNVVVTVEYGQSLTTPNRIPAPADLQGKAEDVAEQLAEDLTE
ncbi:DUF3558 domain-containing protein [Streptomyces sp. A7024]|uniref:DUF3558 domain-containing protein n=1 Tax=Streptomyces coryli TaxID=1128680 RepID=A0A6G4TUS6_9ACTN|nr:DUF3558 domain-containing protein [Streptomyces coryli]